MSTTEEEPRSYFSLPYINTGKITVKPSAGRDGYVSLVFADDLTLWVKSPGFARELVKAAAEALRLLDPPQLDSESWECQRCHGIFIGHRPDGDVCDHCRMLAQPPRIELVPATDEDGNLNPDLIKALKGDGFDPPGCSECGATYTPLRDGRCNEHARCADRVGARDAAKAGTP